MNARREVLRLLSYLGLSAVALVSLAQTSAAQTVRPRPEDAAALLQSRPDLVAQIRQRMLASNLTPEQIRARLKAEGYPENLLDDYMAGARSTGTGVPSSNVFAAIRALGITDSTDVDALERLGGVRSPQRRPSRGPVIDITASRDSTLSSTSAEIFGLSLFRDANSRFQPSLDGPVDSDYRLGPGDQLVLILTGDVERADPLTVTREGFVVIPDVGQLNVANLTLAQLDDLLYARLGRVYSGVRRGADATTHFTVSVSKLRSIQVVVTGDVMVPSSYQLSSAGTAFTALYAAGGPNENGSLRNVQVRRAGRTVATLDVYDYLLRGDAAKDVRLQQGDLLFVPVHGPRVRVDGGVNRPATYELKPGETLADAIADAGGFRATAGGRRLSVERIIPSASRTSPSGDRTLTEVPLSANGPVPAFVLSEGDVVRVPTIADRVANRINIDGNVWSPGPQGFRTGLTLEAALKNAGGVKPDAYLGRVLISRLQPDSTRLQLRAMLRDTTGATVEPFVLAEDDEIRVFSKTNFRSEQNVVIAGAVRKSGVYPWRQGMTLRDLVLRADGLNESAYLEEAEIARIPLLHDGHTTAETIRVRLDSGYLFAQDRAALPPGARDEPLQPFDNVLILQKPGYRLPTIMILSGEVRFPGRYTIKDRGERISDLIARAGGVTALADQDAAYFSRLLSSNFTHARLDSATAASDSARLESGARIRVGVDLGYALKHHGTNEDLVLASGDSLDVPSRRQTVEVRGEVNAPTALAHASGRSLGFYVDAAGGPSARGNARRAYVVQPNGKLESRHHLLGFITLDPTPRPGATVVVPAEDLTRPRITAAAAFGLVAQLLVSVAAIVAVTR